MKILINLKHREGRYSLENEMPMYFWKMIDLITFATQRYEDNFILERKPLIKVIVVAKMDRSCVEGTIKVVNNHNNTTRNVSFTLRHQHIMVNGKTFHYSMTEAVGAITGTDAR